MTFTLHLADKYSLNSKHGSRKINKQTEDCIAFVPNAFPTKGLLAFPPEIISKAAKAERMMGKLDGITHVLPDNIVA
ncbi:MAG: hypothetical protein ABIO55_16160 [Ginsengibacter sp.]